MTTPRPDRRRPALRALALLGALALAGPVLVAALPAAAGERAGAPPLAQAATATPSPDFTATRTLSREHVQPDGSDLVVDQRTVTVSVDSTQNLQGRERIQVSWTGARPTGGRYSDPYGVNGMYQEYPVLILECRGVENPGPGQEQLSRETCWTTVAAQRLGQQPTASAAWAHDRYASEADRLPQSQDPGWPEQCPQLPESMFLQHRLPFRAASGTVFQFCDEATQAPESGIDSAFPPAEIAAVTQTDGTGSVAFEVRTATENESLGCSSSVPCSLVVIPIMGLSCADDNAACRQTGSNAPGSLQPVYGAADTAVTAAYWWSESNWRNRFTVPLTFALPPDACTVLDKRPPVAMYGSELMSQASLQWAPAYCLRADRFKLQHNRKAESAALRLLATNDAVAAFVTEPAASTDPAVSALSLGYAPTAVTGWGIAYVSDLPENTGELTQMKLTPRLVAKLVTQSYPGSAVGRTRPGLADNPLSINRDPEFLELNPGVSEIGNEAMATLASLSESGDVMTALTSYLAQDAEAMAFIAGKPDPWGMTVNPAYRDIALPRSDWPLLDTFVPTFQAGDCRKEYFTTPYLSLIASPVNSLQKISQAMIDAWPFVATRCEAVPNAAPKVGRVTRQAYGGRNMLGLVTLGDAARYGLHVAALRTAGTGPGATFVAPGDASLAAAVGGSTASTVGAPFEVDLAHLPGDAYPGTMVVHTTARLAGLPAADAAHVASFIETATTEGQVPGSLNGQLPEGYLPITSTGVTKPLYDAAQTVAAAVLRQDGTVVPRPTPSPPAASSSSSQVPSRTTGGAALPSVGGDVPVAGPGAVPGLPADDPAAASSVALTARTEALTSGAADRALPVALALCALGALAGPGLRLWSTRRRAS